MKNMERGLAGLVVFRLAPVLLSLDGTSGCLLTGAWTAKLCVSDIVRGAICEALTHRLWRVCFHGLIECTRRFPWLSQGAWAAAKVLSGPQATNATKSLRTEAVKLLEEVPQAECSWWACMRTSDIHCKVVSLKYMKQSMQLAILQTRCTILLNPVLATLGQPSQRRSTAATKAIWSQDWVTDVWKQQVRADVLVTNPRPTQTLCKIDEWIMGFSFSRQV